MRKEKEFKAKVKTFLNIVHSANKGIALAVHRRADPDAVASSFSLKVLLEKLKITIPIKLVAAGGLNKSGTYLSTKLGLTFQNISGLDCVDLIILVDTVNLEHANIMETNLPKDTVIYVIDHHDVNYPKYITEFLSYNRKSTSELILDIYETCNKIPDLLVSYALAVGIVYDTAGLTASDNKSIISLSRLAILGIKIEEVLGYSKHIINYDEIVARAKAVQRLQLHKLGELVIGLSNVGSFGSSAASTLLCLGIELAIVISTINKLKVISVRASYNFYKKTKISIGRDICEKFTKYYGGSGGGHRYVGIIKIEMEDENIAKNMISFLNDVINEKCQKKKN